MNRLLLACPAVRLPGGIAGYSRSLVDAVAPFAVDVVSQGDDQPVYPLPAHARFLGAPRSQAVFGAHLLAAYAARPATTFVLAHLGLTRPLAALPKVRRHRTVLLLHGIEAWSRLPKLRSLGLSRVDVCVFTTAYTREMFLASNGDALRADVQLEVVALSAARALERALPTPVPTGRRRRVLCVSRLWKDERLKGIGTLLAAARRLDPSAWEIVLVGDGPGRLDFETLARETGVADRVRFVGFVPDDARTLLLEGADVLCLPSAQEGFGIVFLEAMLAGRPCVGAAAGAVPEVLPPEAAELFAFDDAAALAAALQRASDRLRSSAITPDSIRKIYNDRYAFARFAASWQRILGA